jgi:hypothetical protein
LETTDLALQIAHPPPQVCAVLLFLTADRLRVFHNHLLNGRLNPRVIAPRVVLANRAVADAETAKIGHRRSNGGDGDRALLQLSARRSDPSRGQLRRPNRLTHVPFRFLEMEAIPSISSISLMISVPRSTVV